MTVALLGSLAGALLGWLMGFLSLFLILLILIQRGKGGGLTGALGGPGGQSAFGSKAGDTFTVITVAVASFWGLTCAFTMWLLGTHAPTKMTETSITAAPGDDEIDPSDSNSLVIPPSGSGLGDLGGIGGLSAGGDEGTANSETPSMELTPKDAGEPSNSEASDTAEAEADTGDAADPDAGETASEDSPPAEPDQSAEEDPSNGENNE